MLIIRNRQAGRRGQQRYEAVVAHLRQAGCELEIVETQQKGEGRAVARANEVRAFDAVIAAGGDGTVHDVASGLLGQRIPLGVIPIGTADVFARELGVPREPERLARDLIDGEAADLPVGKVNGELFLFVVGIGLDAEAVHIFETTGSRTFGRAGLVWPALAAFSRSRHGRLRVRTANGNAEAFWVIVTRAKRYAGDLMLVPAADLETGQFHVVQMTGSALFRLAQLSAMALGALRHAPGVRVESTDWVSIEGPRTMPVQVDGDLLGNLPLDIRPHEMKLRVIRPSRPRVTED